MGAKMFLFVVALLAVPLWLNGQTQYRVELDGKVIGVYSSEYEARSAIGERIRREHNRYRSLDNYDGLTQAFENAAVENLKGRLKIKAVAKKSGGAAPASDARGNVRAEGRSGNKRGSSVSESRANAGSSERRRAAERAYGATMSTTQAAVDALSARALQTASEESAMDMKQMMEVRSSAAVRGHMSLRSEREHVSTRKYARRHQVPDSFFMGKKFRSLDMREGGTGTLRSPDLSFIPYNEMYAHPLSWDDCGRGAHTVDVVSDIPGANKPVEVILNGREQWRDVALRLGDERMNQIINAVGAETGNHFPDLLYNREERFYYMYDFKTGKYMTFSDDGEKFTVDVVKDENDRLTLKDIFKNLKETEVNLGFNALNHIKSDVSLAPFAPDSKEHAKWKGGALGVGGYVSDKKAGVEAGGVSVLQDYSGKTDKIEVKIEDKTIGDPLEAIRDKKDEKEVETPEIEGHFRTKIKLYQNSSEHEHRVLYFGSNADDTSFGVGYNRGRGLTLKGEAELYGSADSKGLHAGAAVKVDASIAKLGVYVWAMRKDDSSDRVCFMKVHPEAKVGYTFKGKKQLGKKKFLNKGESPEKEDGHEKKGDSKILSVARNFSYLPLSVGTGLEVSCQDNSATLKAFYEKINGGDK